MFFEHQAFWLPKDVERSDEFQDAWCVDENRGIAAIADGVSSSLFSGSWAKILTKAVVDEPPYVDDLPALPDWLAGHRAAWLDPIDESKLAWHQKPKFQQGAATTLLWIELYVADQAETGVSGASQVYGYAIGDTCLFHVRDDKVIRSFPMERSEQFQQNPAVINSLDKKHDHLLQFQTWESFCQQGDLLVLCTDAIAYWAMAQMEAGAPPRWQSYWGKSQEDWQQEVMHLRAEQHMRYDDATLLMLRIVDRSAKANPEAALPDDGEV